MKTIIIGAGASGLMAAYELSKKGIQVVILETNDRIGGRVHTFTPDGFTSHIEAGAEFIHGNLPITLGLMKKANLSYVAASLRMDDFRERKSSSHFGSGKQWEDFGKAAKKLRRDCTLMEFLDKNFPPDAYGQLRQEALEMAGGLDLADPEKLSVFCIREEWVSEETQHRPVAGYGPLFEFLVNAITVSGGVLKLGTRVDAVRWKRGKIEVIADGSEILADNIIVTASLGNLQNRQISFDPKIDDAPFHEIGFGEVIKFAMEFAHPFWEATHPELGFLFTDGGFTFWTQLDLRRPLLIGWIGNDHASEYAKWTDEKIVDVAVAYLEKGFPDAAVAKILRKSIVFKYDKSSPSGGGYSWTTPQSKKAIKKIIQGIDDTIWFAGEAFQSKADVGTVEAAFHSGRYIARKILKNRK